MGLFNSSAAAWRQQFGFYITELNQVIVLDFGSYKLSDPNILLQTCGCGWDHRPAERLVSEYSLSQNKMLFFSFYYLFLNYIVIILTLYILLSCKWLQNKPQSMAFEILTLSAKTCKFKLQVGHKMY